MRGLVVIDRGLAYLPGVGPVLDTDAGCCCGECSFYLRGTLCNPVICVPGGQTHPIYLPGCATCPNGEPIAGKVITTPSGACYAVGATHYCPPSGNGEPGCIPIPFGGLIASASIINGCTPSCSGCPPLTGYYGTTPCPCSPHSPVPIYVPCEVYQNALQSRYTCPVFSAGNGLSTFCVEVDPNVLTTNLPTNALIAGGPVSDGCCGCCCSGYSFTPYLTVWTNGEPVRTEGPPTTCCCNPAKAITHIQGSWRLYCACPGGGSALVLEGSMNATVSQGQTAISYHTRTYNCEGQLTGEFDTPGTWTLCGAGANGPFGCGAWNGYAFQDCYRGELHMMGRDGTSTGGCYCTEDVVVTVEHADDGCNGNCGHGTFSGGGLGRPAGILVPGGIVAVTGCSGCGKDGKGGLTI